MKKISEANYPILTEIYNSINLPNYKPIVKFNEPSHYNTSEEALKQALEIYQDGLKIIKNVDYIVNHLFLRIDKDLEFRTKCLEVVSEMPKEESGVLLTPLGSAYIYHTDNNILEGEEKKLLLVYLVYKNKLISFELGDYSEGILKCYTSESFFASNIQDYEMGMSLSFVSSFLIFKHYAEIKTVMMQTGRNKKTRTTHVGEDYELQSRVPVQIIDSRWFTEVVGEGFKVSGHWRKQWYATIQKNKLIWIKDYEKQGYTRKALIDRKIE